MEISLDKHSQFVDRSENFIDPKKQRFFRLTCPDPKKYISAESSFGEVVLFDFLRPHRSGLNSSSLVRVTFLLRATSISDLKSWEEKNA